MDETTTIAAIATPTGQKDGGIGIVRLSGPSARKIGASVFAPTDKSRSPLTMKGYTACHGRIHNNGQEIDEGVLFVYATPKSYTGEDVVELCCHGGSFLLRQVLDACLGAGARLAEPGEFTKRAFLGGKLSLTQAEAVMDLIASRSESAARAALAARDGVLFRKISTLADRLLDQSAHLAAWVDYPEEDVEALEPEVLRQNLGDVKTQLEALTTTYEQGRIWREGIDTAIVGRPNVGKSTLMNLLSGWERSIVTDIPGTTRDVVEETVQLGDIILRLSDTAGIRHSDDPVEQAGVQRSKNRLQSAGLILALFDSSSPLTDDDKKLLESLDGRLTIAVINKSDLPRQLDIDYIAQHINCMVEISAATGEGIAELEAAITRLFHLGRLDPAEPMVANLRQLEGVKAAAAALDDALAAINAGATLDALSVCIDEAVDALLTLTGQRASAAIIDRVFENFCVGK